MLKIHIQLFAEPEGGAPAEPAANPEGAKTFSEDYVKAQRGFRGLCARAVARGFLGMKKARRRAI